MSENKRIKLSDLQGKCTIFKLKTYGTKQTLINRLEKHHQENNLGKFDFEGINADTHNITDISEDLAESQRFPNVPESSSSIVISVICIRCYNKR